MKWTIYYNPRCQTCRTTLALIKAQGVEPEIIEYLKNPPSPQELNRILKMAGLEPENIVRKKEDLFSSMKLEQKKPTRLEWLKILSENPILIERPIVVKGDHAVLARPPEKVKSLF